MCELRYLSVSGRPRSMGEAHGEEYREEIRDFVSRRMRHLIDFVHKYDPERFLTSEVALGTAANLVEA
ncbi:MAG: hypothetical protein JXB46_01845, partial [Candidatus Eisenbacteria bacterium]|nr:hypothetical protein [Candidatus Eisenbacteria bacterium]